MKTVVFYDVPQATMEKFRAVFPQHQSVEDEFIRAGKIVGIGPFSKEGEGAMAIFNTRRDAEDFVSRDPFATEKLFARVTLKEWTDTLLP